MNVVHTPAWVGRLVRGGVFESLYRGHVVVADAHGEVLATLGSSRAAIYARSTIKPFQAAASLSLIESAGATLPAADLAIAASSHEGTAAQQERVRTVLEAASFDEKALQCPPALPEDTAALIAQDGRETRLAHNCSGKHAAFLVAESLAGGDPGGYPWPDSAIQRVVHDHIAHATGEAPLGPGIDGCGAPAWRCTVGGLATAFARLAAGKGIYARLRDAMTQHPELIGGRDKVDSQLMAADQRVVAKRGAEAVFAAGWRGPHGPLGVAVKIVGGSDRAAGAVVAAVLSELGASVPSELMSPIPIPGDCGGAAIEVTGEVASLMA